MAIYPGGSFVPTAWGGKTPRTKGQRGILHVAVSNATNLPPWSVNTWHFYVNKAGQAFQYVDTAWCAWASVDANGDAISIETQGGMGTSAQLNAEPWTDAQAARIADIMRWANAVEGIPLDPLPDSKAGRRGWGTHRLGIDPWRVPGGQVWSGARGKECPGDTKVSQLPAILAAARGPITPEDTMAVLTDQQASDLMEMVSVYLPGKAGRTAGPGWLHLLNAEAAAMKAGAAVDPKALAAAIVAALPAQQAQQVAQLVLGGLDGAKLSVTQPS